MRQRTLVRIAAMAAVLCLAAANAVCQTILVRVDDQPVYFEGTQPHMISGRVLVPLRGVLEQMGAAVDWDPMNHVVTASREGTDMVLPLGSTSATVNGRTVWLDVPARTIGGYTMVPLRFVSQALGAHVAWSDLSQTVFITTDRGTIASGERRWPRGRSGADGDQAGIHAGDRRDDNGHEHPDRRGNPIERTSDNRKPIVAPRDPNPQMMREIDLDADTVVPVRIDDRLSSDQSHQGDRFAATVDSQSNAADLPPGTRFEGVVTEAVPAANGRPGVLAVDIRRVILPSGESRVVNASVTSLDSKDIVRTSGGRMVARGHKSNEQWKWVGIGAGAGLLVSSVAKGNHLLDTLLGAGAGYLYSQLQHKGANNVELRRGTEIGIRLNSQYTFYARRG